MRILNFVLVSYPDREIYQKDIEEELNIRSASVSTLLKKMEAQDIIRREKVSCDERLKKILPTRHTVEMKEQVERHVALLEKRLTAGVGEEELKVFFDVLEKMQENMELTEKGDRYGQDRVPAIIV
nr:MarR family winged helix-turn-helix transcriptional regulator [uncultured Acetatifactor sp.]